VLDISASTLLVVSSSNVKNRLVLMCFGVILGGFLLPNISYATFFPFNGTVIFDNTKVDDQADGTLDTMRPGHHLFNGGNASTTAGLVSMRYSTVLKRSGSVSTCGTSAVGYVYDASTHTLLASSTEIIPITSLTTGWVRYDFTLNSVVIPSEISVGVGVYGGTTDDCYIDVGYVATSSYGRPIWSQLDYVTGWTLSTAQNPYGLLSVSEQPFTLDPSITYFGISTSSVATFCDGSFATTSGFINEIGSSVTLAFCRAAVFLFIPSPSALDNMSVLASTSQTKIPFSYVYELRNIFSGLTASSTANIAALTYNFPQVGSTSPLGSVVPSTIVGLSTTTISTYLPDSARTSFLNLQRVVLWVGLVYLFYRRVIPHHAVEKA